MKNIKTVFGRPVHSLSTQYVVRYPLHQSHILLCLAGNGALVQPDEIEDVADAGYEVEKVTAVAGVRGAEAEDEALHHLYYRQSMKGPSKVELNKALGKLLNTLNSLKDKNPDHVKIPEVTHYVIQIYKKLEKGTKAKELEKELLSFAPESKWAKFYK